MQAYNLLRKKYFHGVSSALHQKAEFSTVFDATSDSALKGSSALVCNFLLSYQQKQGISVETFGAESLFLVQKLLLVQSPQGVHERQVILSGSVPLVDGLAVPLHGLGIIRAAPMP